MTILNLKRSWLSAAMAIGFAFVGSSLLRAEQANAQQPAAPEVLTQGPIHEAFGQPVVFNPVPGVLVPKKPPATVEELPTDQKPAGDNVVWISGYWFWDDQRKDYLWISGFWRAVPAGRTWVPGYWAPSGEGYQWVSGFWSSTDTAQAVYLPQPPESLEAGPNTEAPGADSIWAPGCWEWHETRYFWRPGHWIKAYADWVWVPPHYTWAPSGYLFNSGYWDYPIARRGLLFAPVIFPQNLLAQADYVYTPDVVLDTPLLTNYMFIRPSVDHYYFGDYYAPENFTSGIYPWFAYHNSTYGYDPLFAYSAWSNGRQDPEWITHQRDQYWNRRENVDARPPHTFASMQAMASQPNAQPGQMMARPLAQAAQMQNNPLQLQRVDPTRLKQFDQHARQARGITQERAKYEQQAPAVATRPGPMNPRSPTNPGVAPTQTMNPGNPKSPMNPGTTNPKSPTNPGNPTTNPKSPTNAQPMNPVTPKTSTNPTTPMTPHTAQAPHTWQVPRTKSPIAAQTNLPAHQSPPARPQQPMHHVGTPPAPARQLPTPQQQLKPPASHPAPTQKKK